ncbi:immune inhibitor A [Candidatus Acetothermia bacterium]|nr:immune inhibitor A [Candidatus Acetothermia bacterium]
MGPGTDAGLVTEAVTLADSTVNFANFDNDGDGTVDILGIIYAGGGPHDGCDMDDPPPGFAGDNLWPHFSRPGGTFAGDGVSVNQYIIQSEVTHAKDVNPSSGCTQIQTIGLFAHEFGHALGLPDLYDTDGSSAGIGSWSTMSNQYRSTVNLADTPPHYDPWSKWFEGWITPQDLTSASVAGKFIPQTETNAFTIQLLVLQLLEIDGL